MKEISDSSQPDYWTQRYASAKTPWTFHGVPENLEAFLRRTSSSSRVLIPGSGADFEVIRAFHEAGHEVTAIDFSPAAVDLAKQALGALEGKIILGDFFAYDFGSKPFDLVYERTFLCSLPPSVWEEYIRRVAQLLSVGGKLVGFFFMEMNPSRHRIRWATSEPSSYLTSNSSWFETKLFPIPCRCLPEWRDGRNGAGEAKRRKLANKRLKI